MLFDNLSSYICQYRLHEGKFPRDETLNINTATLDYVTPMQD